MVDHAQCTQVPSADRVQCGKCEKVFARGAVVSLVDSYQFLADLKTFYGKHFQPYVPMLLYCDHCNHVMMWDELCQVIQNPDGKYSLVPTGKVKGAPTYFTDAKHVNEFLRANPQAAGVLQK